MTESILWFIADVLLWLIVGVAFGVILARGTKMAFGASLFVISIIVSLGILFFLLLGLSAFFQRPLLWGIIGFINGFTGAGFFGTKKADYDGRILDLTSKDRTPQSKASTLGLSISPHATGATAARPAAVSSPQYCQSCGTSLQPNATFCSSCGRQIKQQAQVDSASTPQGSDRRRMWRSIIILGLVIFFYGLIKYASNLPIESGRVGRAVQIESGDGSLIREVNRVNATTIMVIGGIVIFIGSAVYISTKQTEI